MYQVNWVTGRVEGDFFSRGELPVFPSSFCLVHPFFWCDRARLSTTGSGVKRLNHILLRTFYVWYPVLAWQLECKTGYRKMRGVGEELRFGGLDNQHIICIQYNMLLIIQITS